MRQVRRGEPHRYFLAFRRLCRLGGLHIRIVPPAHRLHETAHAPLLEAVHLASAKSASRLRNYQMTLVVTELSDAGIAMVADSMITFKGSISGTLGVSPAVYWPKLMKAPRINAGVSYWGDIGAITANFSTWLRREIETGSYADLKSLADFVASSLNSLCHDRPAKGGATAGVHVAGYAPWNDGVPRPTFYHVHNGHLHLDVKIETPAKPEPYVCVSFGTGSALLQPHPRNDREADLHRLLEAWKTAPVRWEPQSEPRKLFVAHQDFPKPDQTVDQNLALLRQGYVTHNGEFALFGLNLQSAAMGSPLYPTISFAATPAQIGFTIQRLTDLLEKTIAAIALNPMTKTVGGELFGLGIDARGSYSSCDRRL